MTYPSRGEVWLVDLGLAAKIRPCVVISRNFGEHDRALITLVPHTTAVRETEYEASVAAKFLKPGAFDAQGIVTVPAVRAMRRLGALPSEQMRAVEVAVCRWLGLPCDHSL